MGFLNFYRSFRKKSPPQKEIQKPPSILTRSSFQDETRRVFDKFDANGDGKISLEEYKQALKVLGGGATTTAEAAKSFRVADADGDGFIDLEEFSKVYSSDGGAKSGDIQAAFRVFDSDGDGKISAEELMEVLKRMGERCSLEGCKRMIRGVDGDGDGLIDMDEFINMMKQSMNK
ncbi:UNVERIFIED_CONTAM: Calmodulin-like protein 30 [Sesamum calycinum]|uniref:Calmodulin-like protein 30 n=1 Tax=Sesamum calycinum TaxID=2727403 RepID=A0AAW2SX60_9LAMI